jgi:hypothetical protein
VVDVLTGALRYRTTSDLLVGAVAVPGRALAAWGWTAVWVLGPDGERWDADVALDGIERVTATPEVVRDVAGRGLAPFTLELDGRRLHHGPLVRAG